MGYTVCRGGAVAGARLCKECSSEYFEYDPDNRLSCKVCGRKILESIGVALCRFCSAELGRCQGRIEMREDAKSKKLVEWMCEAELSIDIEELKKARRGDRKGKK